MLGVVIVHTKRVEPGCNALWLAVGKLRPKGQATRAKHVAKTAVQLAIAVCLGVHNTLAMVECSHLTIKQME